MKQKESSYVITQDDIVRLIVIMQHTVIQNFVEVFQDSL